MRRTLLDYVQSILGDMDSDEVNSISDTIESEQVAVIVRDTYYAILTNRNWPHTKENIQLTPSGTSSRPTHMSLPDNVKELVMVTYDCVKEGESRKRFKEMRWKENDEFLRLMYALNTDNDNVDTILDPTGVSLFVKNDTEPRYYTSFDDTTLVFDAYDSAVDDALKASKTQAIAYVMPEWTHADEFVPDLPIEAETALLEEAKSRAMFKLKQIVDVKSESEANKQQRWLSRKAWRVNGGVKYPNYGRRGRKGTSQSINFDRNSS